MKRRRFLTISAAMALVPRGVAAEGRRWTGQALGAEVSITLFGPVAQTEAALTTCTALLQEIEAEFSLYDPASALSRLNRDGELPWPSPNMHFLMGLVGEMHRMTRGRFDPTVQPLWQALAGGGDVTAARRAIGWQRVRASVDRIALAPGQSLTLNGIAQGFATDLVTRVLEVHGFERALVQVGEMRGLGGPWRVGISDPDAGLVTTRDLRNRAIATSSPSALMLGDMGHILDPLGEAAPHWSTVSVEAGSAALADGLSTALVLADLDEVRRVKAETPGEIRVLLVDAEGNLRTV
ncbi:thiamine biosynthesis lipoprotein [Mameliella alba]|uniref:FAD:protein FMN transferase n=1 Tax=Mameliella alba TaxID=561184 RepID=UPI00088C3EE3|nr:FAD:protein FMN transferase [Mameliella alba]OWV47993.1 FAD:protein FMN transferase [Mameliella alba]PTR39599.1 thiamine biosynthesis lipoprotein [Mameliella alba]GGF63115.1 FAD:protein FMN transferase [Mameliella alba]SDD18504.1 thiamine biosynthesis lipoprotein [Mameliella alba]